MQRSPEWRENIKKPLTLSLIQTKGYSAVEKAASQKAESKVLEMEVKAKELAASNARAEADVKLKSRELDMIEKNWNWRTKKTTVELNMLILQEKEQLLFTRKRLMDAGVAMAEIDSIPPVNK